MSRAAKGVLPACLSASADLDLLEKEIHAALRRTWIMLGLLLGTGLMVNAYLVGKHVLP